MSITKDKEDSLLTMRITGTKKELETYLGFFGATVKMEDIKNFDWTIINASSFSGSKR